MKKGGGNPKQHPEKMDVQKMKFEEYKPTKLLKPFIKTYKIIESQNELVNRVLPNTSFALAFRFKGQTAYLKDNKQLFLPTTTFSGLRKSVRLINYLPDSSTIIVLFKEIGVSAFFRGPFHEIYEKSVSLDSFFSQTEVSIIEEKLSEAENNTERITIIEQFLVSNLYSVKADDLISKAIAKIHETNGSIRMKELASMLCISQDAFEKRFRKTIGSSPKQFSSIIRMNAVIKQEEKYSSFTDLALDNGYFDQAHFNKDFKLFTGQTPTQFFKSAIFW